MSSKITSEHLCRAAAVYIRQSTLSQVLENTESQRRQYELAEAARAAGFASVTVSTTISAARDPEPRSAPGSRSWPRRCVPDRSARCTASRPPGSPGTAGLASSDRSVRAGRRAGYRPGRGLRPAPGQ